MTEFEAAIMGNFIIFNILLAVVNVILCGHLAQRLKRGVAMSVLGFFIALLKPILTAAVAVSAVAAWHSSWFFTAAAENSLGSSFGA
ncbi:hypothetical protein [Mesorhizobium sp.]|nr:hypothetical protein [Mesorhizobium sp.]